MLRSALEMIAEDSTLALALTQEVSIDLSVQWSPSSSLTKWVSAPFREVVALAALRATGRLDAVAYLIINDLRNLVEALATLRGLEHLESVVLKLHSGLTLARVDVELLGLQAIPGLRTLRVGNYFDSVEVDLKYLIGLRLEWLSIEDVCALGVEGAVTSMPMLSGLQIEASGLTSLSFLEGLSELRVLHLEGLSPSVSTAPIGALSGLTELRICATKSGLACVSRLRALEKVYLTAVAPVPADVLDPIATVATLKSVYLDSFDAPVSLEPIGRIRSLETLHIYDSAALRTLPVFGHGSPLRELEVGNCPWLEDISSLEDCRVLQRLGLRGCVGVSDLRCLRKLGELSHVDLQDCNPFIDRRPIHEDWLAFERVERT